MIVIIRGQTQVAQLSLKKDEADSNKYNNIHETVMLVLINNT